MAKLPELPWGDVKLLMTEFGIDASIKGDWLNIDNWTQPSGAASGSETPRVLSELGDGVAAVTGKGSHTTSFDPAANRLDLVSEHRTTPAWGSEGGLKLTGLTEAAARLGIHLDSTLLDRLAAKASGLWHNMEKGHADSFLTSTTTIPEAVADIGTVSTRAAVTTSSLFAASSSAIDPIFETRVATAGDDVEQKGSGSISSNTNDLELGYDSSTRQTVGIRFTGIDIPQGAIITSAYIQFQANEVKTGATSLLIKGEDTDDASAFTNVSFNVSSRATTDASTAWTPDPWTTVGAHGLAERSPDLSTIVQEIVNRSGWAALNDMAFMVTGTGTRTADSYEYSPTSAPLLHIEYLLPGSGVAFNTPADADAAVNQIAELAAAGVPTGITASATDPDAGSTVTYSLNDSRFAIDASSGVITRSATGALDFETQSSINLTVTATSSDGSTANQVFTLAVLNSPEPVAFNSSPDANPAANQIAQNAAAGTAIGITAAATDPDTGSSVTYSIDDSRFAINASTGVITRSSTGALNAQSEPSIALTVTATSSDGSIDTHAFNVDVTANQLPVAFNAPPDANAAANQIAELAAAGALTGITASATDPDAGSTVTYSINDSRFAIDASSGVITRSATGALDFETQSSIDLTVTATSSDGSTANQAFTLAVLNSPEPIAFNSSPDANPAANQIAELAAAGALTGITASATDPDAGSTITYSLNDSRFAIDASSGVITRSATGALDFETQSSINLTVTATSSDGSTANQVFTLAVLNSPEPIAFNSSPDANPAANQIAQNAAAGTAIGITAAATDPDAGSTVTYSIGDPRFAINASTGVITRSSTGTLNAQSEPSVALTVTATSSDGSIDTHAFSLNVTASQMPVAFNAPPDANAAANQIAELAAAGALTGITASATDPDAGSTVTYSINDSRFAINSSSGVITRSATGALDFETQSSINLTVTATSSDGSTANQAFTLAVLNSPEPIAFNSSPDANPAANQIAELAAAGALIGITASATDPDAGSTVTYSINDSRFAINSSSGVITRSATGALDFETQSSINLTVTATSSDGSTANQVFTLAVLNSPEAVAFNSSPDANPAANEIAQNAAAGTAIGITAAATDPDAGSTVTYSIGDSRFAINSSTGVITRSSTGTLNAQSEPSVALTVTATSSDGSIDTHAFSLNVTAHQLPTSVTLAHTILTSLWSPPSPDPTDIVYISHLGTLLVADSEVEEMSIFTGKNLYQMTLSGTLVGTLTTVRFSDEPAGITYNPANHHLFFSDDTGTKSVYELNPGNDGLYNTSDDIVTSFKTSAFGSTDPESVAYDTKRGVLYVADGSTQTIYTVAPGQNGKFDGVASTGGDDIVTSFSAHALGTPSDESIAYDPVNDLLYIIQSRNSVAMVTTTGELLGTLDISSAHAKKPAGLALAPSSDDPSHHMSLYIVDRGVDNDSNPTENDGNIYEFHFNDWLV